jgi:predicted ArsR family transcriptional regulator
LRLWHLMLESDVREHNRDITLSTALAAVDPEQLALADQIAKRLGVTRQAVSKRMQVLA